MHSKPAILLLEKHEGEYHRLNAALRRSGFDLHVHWAHNSADARAYLAGEDGYNDRVFFPFPDLILADASIAPNDSLEFVSWMRGEHELRNIPVVLLGLPNGNAPAVADESAPKPCDSERLTQLLASLLARHCNDRRRSEHSQAEVCAA